MRQKRKACFSILEMVIGFSLLSLLLSSLFLCFKNQLLFFRKNDVMESAVFKEIFLHDHLSKRFLNLKADESATTLYSTRSEEEGFKLHFTFNNGVQKDLDFAGDVKGHVYVDRQTKELISEVISLEKKSEKRQKSVLAKNVESMLLSFIHPDSFTEQDFWDSTENQLPLGICIKLKSSFKKAPDTQNFYFILLQNPPHYHYKGACS